MSMDTFLAEYFGTMEKSAEQPQPTGEDAEKVAQAELFYKLAKDNGIDVSKLNDAQVDWLWTKTFSKEATAPAAEQPAGTPAPAAAVPPVGTKTAGEMPPQFAHHAEKGKEEHHEEHEKKEHLEKAKKEHEEKHASKQRFEEATYFGKVAAHSYVAELKKIAQAGGLATTPAAAAPTSPPATKTAEEKKHEEDEEKKKKEHDGEHMPPQFQKKEGSFDFAAAEIALKKIAEAKLDTKVATARLNAVLTLGLSESEKVAAIENFETALERRALEMCEAAGYPVQWNQ